MILSNFPTKTITPESIGAIPNPSGGTTGQVLTKTSTGEEWSDAPSGLPEGGTEGQILYRGANGAEWGDKPVMYVNITTSGAGFSADKTAQEIYEAVQKGFVVFAKLLGEQTIPLLQYTNDSSMFYKVTFDGGVLISISGSAVEIQGEDLKASGVSFTPTSTVTSDNVQDAIEEVDTQLSTKLTTPTGTAGQLLGFTADNTVGAVDAPEIGLTQEQADERYLQLSGGMVSGNLAVIGAAFLNNLDGGVVSIVNSFSTDGGIDVNFNGTRLQGVDNPVSNSDAANKAYVDSKSPTSVTVTLTTSGWSSNTQTVTVSGVVASNTAQLITPIPSDSSRSAYYAAGIMCTEQAANSLTFTCQTVPTIDLIVYVVIQPLS